MNGCSQQEAAGAVGLSRLARPSRHVGSSNRFGGQNEAANMRGVALTIAPPGPLSREPDIEPTSPNDRVRPPSPTLASISCCSNEADCRLHPDRPSKLISRRRPPSPLPLVDFARLGECCM